MANKAISLKADFSAPKGDIRPLHGVNFGPISFNGLYDFSEPLKALHIPFTRLHDCQYSVPGVVDVHCLFPLFHADHLDPRNYIFKITDDYLQSIRDIGSQIIYRLGETIEHYRRGKYFIYSPPDAEKWAQICARVFTEGNDEKSGVGILGAWSEETGEAALLVSNVSDESGDFHITMCGLPSHKPLVVSKYLLDVEHDLALVTERTVLGPTLELSVKLPGPGVMLYRIQS